MPPRCRTHWPGADIELDDVRKRFGVPLGAGEQT